MPHTVRTFARARNLLVLAVVLGSLLGVATGLALRGDRFAMVHDPDAAIVASLIAEHGCWQGPAPSDMVGRIPGHVVVTPPGADGPVYAGRRLTGAALEQVFDGREAGLTVHAFCR